MVILFTVYNCYVVHTVQFLLYTKTRSNVNLQTSKGNGLENATALYM